MSGLGSHPPRPPASHPVHPRCAAGHAGRAAALGTRPSRSAAPTRWRLRGPPRTSSFALFPAARLGWWHFWILSSTNSCSSVGLPDNSDFRSSQASGAVKIVRTTLVPGNGSSPSGVSNVTSFALLRDEPTHW